MQRGNISHLYSASFNRCYLTHAFTDYGVRAWAAWQKRLFMGAELGAVATQHLLGLDKEGVLGIRNQTVTLGPKRLEMKQLLQVYSSFKWWGLIQTFKGTFPQGSLPALQHRTRAFPQAMQGRQDGEKSSFLLHLHFLQVWQHRTSSPLISTDGLESQRDIFFSSPTLKNYFFLTCACWMY